MLNPLSVKRSNFRPQISGGDWIRPPRASETGPACLRPARVLITGGHEVGGLASFAEALASGFRQLGIDVEIIPPARILSRWSDLRSPRVLKILSTAAIFAAPLARRAVCVTHGFPTAGVIGWRKFLAHLLADSVANRCRNVRFTTVSEYAAAHLRSILSLRVDAVVPNPVRQVFLDPWDVSAGSSRNLITYAGRLHPSKNLCSLLPSILRILEESPHLRACMIGDGPERVALESLAAGHPRVEFTGTLGPLELRERLRQSRVFLSGCPTEALGIAYLEALSQGCNVVMPACGGGLEIAPQLIGTQIQLMPLAFDDSAVAATLHRALAVEGSPLNVEAWSPGLIASAYLRAAGFFDIPGSAPSSSSLAAVSPCA